ncbi:hypothetical protein CDL12_24748 [Handroanthus impetiginosus]|uniref:Uncharacterized protein n=1 Tax=Handroanthus impetiginosus TaxID=429701 RepID=A0A2G9GBS3_9LAMI|nr:hypothetical protein CDL12_24748 [Handroanthus impetiginosus]
MPHLNISLHFYLTPIVMINGLSYCDLLLNSQNLCRSIHARAEKPQNMRALILGWIYYSDSFNNYPSRFSY